MKLSPLSAGAAEATITPPVGAPLLGPMCPATGVHDDLYARALVLSDGASSVAVVCLDLVGMGLALAEEISAAVRQQAGVDAVLLISTHTHSAPFTIPWSLLGREWLYGPDGERWRGELLAAVVGVSGQAMSRLRRVRLRAGRAQVQIGMNRRLATPDGTVMRPNPDGVTVPWADALCLDAEQDEAPVAVLFSHAAHPVVVHGASSLVSADYPGYAVSAVRRGLGADALALFAQGCGANINANPLRGGFEAAERAGEALAEAVLRAVADARSVPAGPLRWATTAASLPLRPLPPPEAGVRTLQECEQRLARAQADGVQGDGLFDLRDELLCTRDLLAKAQDDVAETLPFRVTALAIGDEWCLVGMTHEVFAEYHLWLERASPWPHTMVAAYTNGCESYIPTDTALEEGGYEASSHPETGAALRYPYRVALAPGCEHLVRDALQQVLRPLAQGQGTRSRQ